MHLKITVKKNLFQCEKCVIYFHVCHLLVCPFCFSHHIPHQFVCGDICSHRLGDVFDILSIVLSAGLLRQYIHFQFLVQTFQMSIFDMGLVLYFSQLKFRFLLYCKFLVFKAQTQNKNRSFNNFQYSNALTCWLTVELRRFCLFAFRSLSIEWIACNSRNRVC